MLESVDDPIHTIALSGHPELVRLHQLRGSLDSAVVAEQSHVLVDLTGLEALTAATVGLLLGTGRQLGRNGRRLAVVSPNPHFARIFEISGVALTVEFYSAVEEARHALRG